MKSRRRAAIKCPGCHEVYIVPAHRFCNDCLIREAKELARQAKQQEQTRETTQRSNKPKTKLAVKHLRCGRCGGVYVIRSRDFRVTAKGKSGPKKKPLTLEEKLLARRACLCPACLQLDLAEEQALPDYRDIPRDQREVPGGRLKIHTRYHFGNILKKDN